MWAIERFHLLSLMRAKSEVKFWKTRFFKSYSSKELDFWIKITAPKSFLQKIFGYQTKQDQQFNRSHPDKNIWPS